MVNVFVNCPYLSPTTPYSDPHYAGSFSFFGASKPMPGMPGMAAATYVVDITKAVLESGFSPETIKLQLMPLPAIAGAGSSAAFQVGKVEILAV
jgi:tyrosinase